MSARPGLGTFLRTVVHLTGRQIAHQLRYRLTGPPQRPAATSLDGLTDLVAPMPAPSPEGEPGPDGVCLLRQPPHDPLRHGWTPPAGRLWLYTLHYHGWLQRESPARALATLEHWIAHHRQGVGWEPYPTAMRVLHWLGWLSGHLPDLDAATRRRLLGSLAAQLHHLERHLEHHLDGNHLWTDLAALAAAALALGGPRARRLAPHVARFAALTAAQLAPDGVHRERTPSYHCLLAEQLAGVVALGPARADPLAAPVLQDSLARMLAALPVFTHPDGDVALFGDSQRDAPVTPARLAARCGAPLPLQTDADAPASGFFRRVWGPWTLLWNAGGLGLLHQVGHLHGDWLAYELALCGERVVVDAGVGTYDIGPAREFARSTRAHNTVTVGVGDPDQHELWASHRIGGRADLFALSFSSSHLQAAVRGFRAAAVHHRRLDFDGRHLRCSDRVLPERGPPVPATMRIHLPAACRLDLDGPRVRVLTPRGLTFTIAAPAGLRWQLTAVPGWRAMFDPAPRHCLALPVGPAGLTITFAADAP